MLLFGASSPGQRAQLRTQTTHRASSPCFTVTNVSKPKHNFGVGVGGGTVRSPRSAATILTSYSHCPPKGGSEMGGPIKRSLSSDLSVTLKSVD